MSISFCRGERLFARESKKISEGCVLEHNERFVKRRSIRLKEYDYSQIGAYFLTICTYHRQCLLGDMVDGGVVLSSIGTIVVEEWLRSAEIRKEIELDAFVIMPNHLHGIVAIHRGERQTVSECLESQRRAMKAKTIGSFVSGFKAAATVRANELCGIPGQSLWQRNYYEHVIRGEKELNRIREYIENNPLRWQIDRENPDRKTNQVRSTIEEDDLYPWED